MCSSTQFVPCSMMWNSQKSSSPGEVVLLLQPAVLEAVKVVPELHKLWLGFWGPGWWYCTVSLFPDTVNGRGVLEVQPVQAYTALDHL